MDMVNPASPSLPVSRPNIHRQSSTSSSGSESQRPRKVRSTKRRSSATQDEGSRRGSASSMRNSTAPYEGPITYTPTTHRISKAKKGKRVHACEFAGCNKIFTRAEHKRRHELNHSPEASYPCDRAGCRKAFHRLDLLQRHQERHLLDAATEGGVGHRRLPSDQSSTSVAHSMLTSTAMASPPMVSVQASNGLSIPSLLHPPSSEYSGHSNAYEFVPRAAYPMYSSSISASDDYIYSSPESSQSPLSDHYGYPHRNSISSSSSVVDFVPPHSNSPLLTSSASWHPVLPPSALPSNCNPLEDDIGFSSTRTGPSIPISISQLDGHEWHVLRRELVAAAGAEPGGHDRGLEIFHTLRDRQDVHLAAYWDRFNPVMPVVHHPSFSATASALTTATMIAIGAQYDTHSENADNARQFSLAMFEAVSRAAKRETIHSQSRLSDLQTVFLLEAFAKFRSRRPETSLSPRYRELFARLNHTSTRHWISRNPLALLNTPAASSSSGKTPAGSSPSSDQAHTFWLNHETRRRLLLASFLLDRMTSTLFGDGGMVLFPSRPHASEARVGADLPFPCDQGLWECERADWGDRAQRYTQQNIGAVAESMDTVGGGRHGIELDTFQSLLLGCYRSHLPSPSPLLSPLPPRDTSIADRAVLLTHHALRAAHNTPIHPLLIVAGESWLFGRKIADKAEYEAARGKVSAWLEGEGASAAAEHAAAVLWLGLGCKEDDEDEEEEEELENEDGENDDDDNSDNDNDNEEEDESESENEDDEEQQDKHVNKENNTDTPLSSTGLHPEWCIYIAALICWACTTSPNPTTSTTTSPSLPPFSRSSSGSSLSQSFSLSTPLSQSPSTSTSGSGTSTPAHAHTHTTFPTQPSTQPQLPPHGFPALMAPADAENEMLAFLTEVRGRLAAADGTGTEGKIQALRAVEVSSRGMLEFVRTRVLDTERGGLENDAVGVLFRLGEGRGVGRVGIGMGTGMGMGTGRKF